MALTHKVNILGIVAVVLILAMPATSSAEENRTLPTWVDLDGDGFNDLAEDADQDGIPDFGIKHEVDETAGPDQSGIFAAMEKPLADIQVDDEPNSLQFGQLTKLTLSQSLTRCDLEAAFGSGSNDNSSAAAGGACAGGVCLR